MRWSGSWRRFPTSRKRIFRWSMLPGRAQPAGSWAPTVYVGIREAGRPGLSFRAAPTSDVTLPDEVVDAYRRFETAWVNSMRDDRRGEDDSNGYALFGDDATREIQKQFVPLAQRHFDRLAEVLRTAKSAEQRNAAAWVLGYAADKKKAAAELDAAVRDPNPKVRNNAIRGLAVILGYAAKHPELAIDAPIDAYLDLVESVEWTDRNKAMAVLGELERRPQRGGFGEAPPAVAAGAGGDGPLANRRACEDGLHACWPHRRPERRGADRRVEGGQARRGDCSGAGNRQRQMTWRSAA